MPSITNGDISVNFSIGAKNSQGVFTISATFYNNSAISNYSDIRLSCSLTDSSPWSRIDVGIVQHGQSKSGSVSISSGNQGSQNVYCYLLVGGQTSGSGGAYSVPAYNPPTPTYYNHVLTYHNNGGSGAPSSQTITNTLSNAFSVTLSSTTPSRTGYTFLGWSLSSTGTAQYQPSGEYTFNTNNADIYAIWTANPYTMTVNKYGSGTVRINGTTPKSTYNRGETLLVQVTPSNQGYYYLQAITKIVSNVETIITQEHTIKSYEFTMTMENNTRLEIYFAQRSSHTLSVTSDYNISGTGTYLYLDNPTLLCDFNGNLVVFDGWYENGEKVSSSNPYTFAMPDRNVNLTVETGGEIFANLNVRQFALQNGKGEVFQLTSRNSKVFLNEPKNLGLSASLTVNRLGNSEVVNNKKFNMPQPSGELIFYKDGISGIYKDYYDFVRFASNEPLTLWYKIPTNIETNIFHIPVEITSLNKGEIGSDGCLHVPMNLYGLNFWQISQTIVDSGSNEIEVFNDSDFNVGIKIGISLEHSTAFDNPVIKFIQNNEVYGLCAILKSGITRMEIDTRDKNQIINLYDGDDLIPNPFTYINFAYADGNKDFPFPKLKQGYTTIQFTYDDEDSTDKSYVVEFDKEYLSV